MELKIDEKEDTKTNPMACDWQQLWESVKVVLMEGLMTQLMECYSKQTSGAVMDDPRGGMNPPSLVWY